jgi:hypothetical protein
VAHVSIQKRKKEGPPRPFFKKKKKNVHHVMRIAF